MPSFSRETYVGMKKAIWRIEEGREDGTLLVLKGHLIIEELIRRKLEQCLPRPRHLMRANLGFFQVLCIFRTIFGNANSSDESLWDVIEAWNTLRNRLAHRLEPTDTQQVIQRILCEEPNWPYPFEHEETQNGLSLTLGVIVGYLEAMEPLLTRSVPEPSPEVETDPGVEQT